MSLKSSTLFLCLLFAGTLAQGASAADGGHTTGGGATGGAGGNPQAVDSIGPQLADYVDCAVEADKLKTGGQDLPHLLTVRFRRDPEETAFALADRFGKPGVYWYRKGKAYFFALPKARDWKTWGPRPPGDNDESPVYSFNAVVPGGETVGLYCKVPEKASDRWCGVDRADPQPEAVVQGVPVLEKEGLHPLQANFIQFAKQMEQGGTKAVAYYLEHQAGLTENYAVTHNLAMKERIQDAKSLYLLGRKLRRSEDRDSIIVDHDGAAALALRPVGDKTDLDEIADMIHDRANGKQRLLALYDSTLSQQETQSSARNRADRERAVQGLSACTRLEAVPGLQKVAAELLESVASKGKSLRSR